MQLSSQPFMILNKPQTHLSPLFKWFKWIRSTNVNEPWKELRFSVEGMAM